MLVSNIFPTLPLRTFSLRRSCVLALMIFSQTTISKCAFLCFSSFFLFPQIRRMMWRGAAAVFLTIFVIFAFHFLTPLFNDLLLPPRKRTWCAALPPSKTSRRWLLNLILGLQDFQLLGKVLFFCLTWLAFLTFFLSECQFFSQHSAPFSTLARFPPPTFLAT